MDAGVEGPGELVGGQDVHTAVADEGRARGDGVQDPLRAAVGLPPGSASPGAGEGEGIGAVGRVGQVEQVGAFGATDPTLMAHIAMVVGDADRDGTTRLEPATDEQHADAVKTSH